MITQQTNRPTSTVTGCFSFRTFFFGWTSAFFSTMGISKRAARSLRFSISSSSLMIGASAVVAGFSVVSFVVGWVADTTGIAYAH
jgi:hypothetical protein